MLVSRTDPSSAPRSGARGSFGRASRCASYGWAMSLVTCRYLESPAPGRREREGPSRTPLPTSPHDEASDRSRPEFQRRTPSARVGVNAPLPPSGAVHRFKGWELRTDEHLLLVDGRPARLGRPAYKLLLALIEAGGSSDAPASVADEPTEPAADEAATQEPTAEADPADTADAGTEADAEAPAENTDQDETPGDGDAVEANADDAAQEEE